MSVSKRIRFEILKRDGHTCIYCGASAPDAKLTVDHVVPVALGGSDQPENLVAACVDCNAGKSSVHPDDETVAQVSETAVLWARALAVALDNAEHEAGMRAEQIDEFDAAWSRWTYDDGTTVSRHDNWRASVGHWIDIGVSVSLLTRIVDEVVPAGRVPDQRMWTYFCGAVWRTIREAQDQAEQYIDRGFNV